MGRKHKCISQTLDIFIQDPTLLNNDSRFPNIQAVGVRVEVGGTGRDSATSFDLNKCN